MHIKNIHYMKEKLSEAAKHEVETKSIKDINAKELGEVIDMIKDLSEAEYYAKITKAMEESEYGEDYDKDGPLEQRMYYRGQSRDSMGRFTSGRRGRRGGRRGYEMMMPMDDVYDEDYWRQMDVMQGKMFYPESRYDNNIDWNSNDGRRYVIQGSSSQGGNTQIQGSNDGGNRGTNSSSRYGYSHDEYMKEKKMNSGQDEHSKKKRMDKLEEYMNDLSSMAKDMVMDMSPEEKQLWKVKLNKLINM